MKLQELLNRFGKEKGLGEISLNSQGIAKISVNETLLLQFEKSIDEKGFYLYSSLGFVLQEHEEKVFMQALTGNLFGSQTGRAGIGYHPESRSLVLFEYFDENLTDFDQFYELVETFCQYLAFWVEKINEVQRGNTPSLMQLKLKDLQETKKLKIFFA